MTALIALLAVGAYLCGAALVARSLFVRWRPARAPLCGVRRHYGSGCHTCYRAGETCTREHHNAGCYRRQKADLTSVHIDKDSHAAGWAVFASVAWPLVLAGLALMRKPPELPAEKLKRLEDLEKEAGLASDYPGRRRDH